MLRVLGGGLLVFFLFNMLTAGRDAAKAPSNATSFIPGDRAVLACRSGDGAFVAFSVQAWSRMAHAQSRRNNAELNRLIESDQVALVANGTALELADSGTLFYRVRILAGPHEGREAWLRKQYVRPAVR